MLAIDSADNSRHVDYIKLGIEDRSAEARMGLAFGLKDTFSPALVPLVLDWFTREMDGEIRSQILDHLTLQSERCEAYKEHALDAFERASPDGRDRMLATAAGSPLYSSLSQIKYNNGDVDLFGGATVVTNNTTNVNIGGNVQGGTVSFGGNATNTEGGNNTYNIPTLEVIQSRLADAEREIKVSVADVEAKREALLTIEAAKKEPTKDNLAKAVSAMKNVESIAKTTLGVGTAVAGIAKLVAQAAGIG